MKKGVVLNVNFPNTENNNKRNKNLPTSRSQLGREI